MLLKQSINRYNKLSRFLTLKFKLAVESVNQNIQ